MSKSIFVDNDKFKLEVVVMKTSKDDDHINVGGLETNDLSAKLRMRLRFLNIVSVNEPPLNHIEDITTTTLVENDANNKNVHPRNMSRAESYVKSTTDRKRSIEDGNVCNVLSIHKEWDIVIHNPNKAPNVTQTSKMVNRYISSIIKTAIKSHAHLIKIISRDDKNMETLYTSLRSNFDDVSNNGK